MTGDDITFAIAAERDRQAQLWDHDHAHGHGDCSSRAVSDAVKVAVLSEEAGEVARAFLDGDHESLRRELIQVAAVAQAWLEAL